MDLDFALKVVSSFLVGGSYVLAVTWLSERLGSRAGAAVAGLPSTILVGLVFIVLTEGPEAGRTAVAVVPFMFAATLIYALFFLHTIIFLKSRFRYPVAVGIATTAWLFYSLTIRQFSDTPFLYIAGLGLASLFIFWYALRKSLTVSSTKVKLPSNIYFLRFSAGGLIIACSVIAARFLDPAWGGIVASFPAMLGVILYFLSRSQGEMFLKGFLKSLPLSYISSLAFVVIVHQTLTSIPSVLSFAIGMLGAFLYMILLLSFKSVPVR